MAKKKERFARTRGTPQMPSRRRLFVRGPGTDDTWLYCGTVIEEAAFGATNMLGACLEDFLTNGEPGAEVSYGFKLIDMTDEQVKRLPEV